MIITCDKCSTKFNLDESLLEKDGSRVRCSICRNLFTVYPPLKKEKNDSPPLEQEEEQPLSLEPGTIPDSIDEMDQNIDSHLKGEESESVYDLDFDTDFELDDDFTAVEDAHKTEEDTPLKKDPGFEDNLEFEEDLEFEGEFDDDLTFETTDTVQDIDNGEEKNQESDFELDLDMEFEDTHREFKDVMESDLDVEDSGGKKEEGTDETLDDELDIAAFDKIKEPDKAIVDQPPPEQDLSHSQTASVETSKEDVSDKEIKPPSPVLTPEQDEEQRVSGEDHKAKDGFPGDITHGFQPADDMEKPVKKPAKVGKPVFILLIAAILILAGYSICIMRGITIPYISDINIPFLTQYLTTHDHTTASVQLIPDKKSINGRFVTNSTAGTLFVITGRVTNSSKIACSHIKVTGILITKGKIKSKSKTVFCGNLIAESKLASLNMTAINALLSRKTGNNNSNVKIAPNHAISFMIVFSDLPENLKNFTVNVAGFDKEAIKK